MGSTAVGNDYKFKSKALIKSYSNGSIRWHEMYFEDSLQYLEIDSNNDGMLDRAYFIVPTPEHVAWFETVPDKQLPFVDPDFLLDFEDMSKFIEERLIRGR